MNIIKPPAFNEIKILAHQVKEAHYLLEQRIEETKVQLQSLSHVRREKQAVKKAFFATLENQKNEFIKQLENDILEASDRRSMRSNTEVLAGYKNGVFGIRESALAFFMADQIEQIINIKISETRYPGEYPDGLSDEEREKKMSQLQNTLNLLESQKRELENLLENIGV